MKPDDFVAAIRKEMIDDLVEEYASMFTSHDLSEFTDKEIISLGQHWKASDPAQHRILKLFIRLGAQNAIASLLSILDDSSRFDIADKDLMLAERDGSNLSGDLLDIFWNQEEEAGHVN